MLWVSLIIYAVFFFERVEEEPTFLKAAPDAPQPSGLPAPPAPAPER
jgi:hypothetical protein